MQQKHIPYEKLSKKAKKAYNAQQRGSWGALNPVTRRPPNPNAYQRSKARNWRNDSDSAPLLFYFELSVCTAGCNRPGNSDTAHPGR